MDYRDEKKPGKTDDDAIGKGQSSRWWKRKGDDIAAGIGSDLTLLRKHQTQRAIQYVVSTRLYGNLPPLPFGGMSTVKLNDRISGIIRDRLTFNVVNSAIETLVSKLAKNKPRPWFLTSGGDYRQQRRAKGLTRFVDGVFYENDADAKMQTMQRDACVYGDGLIHVFARNGRVAWERALAVEMYADELEGYYGKPRSLHRVKDVDRAMLADQFPDHADGINTAPSAFSDSPSLPLVGDMVQVRESWHLPSGEESEDGRHVISVEGCTLLDEEWEHNWFPFARLQFAPRLYGYWGQGAAEQLQPIQLEINKLLSTISKSMWLAGTFKIFLENGSKVVKEHLNNDIGTMITYTGTPPQYALPPVVQPEVYQQFETLCRKAYEQIGVSQLSANSQKPAGLNSGKALREYNDIESDRFLTIGQQYERASLELSRLSIETVKSIAKRGRYRVFAPEKGRALEIDWADIRLDESDYVMKCFPVSSLPNDPAGRLQTIQEYAQAGYLTPRQAQRLLAFPDLEQEDSLASAMEDHLTSALEGMVYEGKAYQPEPYDDLAMARELALEMYARGRTNGLEEERMEMLRAFMGRIDEMQQAMIPPAAPVPSGASPQAVPMAPPQSDLLPTMPGGMA